MAERTKEELEQLLKNALEENSELQGKLDVADASNKNLRERLDLAQKGLRLANIDSLPKEVADDARRRMGMGLPEATAIQKALDQYAHDQRVAKAVVKKNGKVLEAHADFIAQLTDGEPDVHAIRDELHAATVQTLRKVIDGLTAKGFEIESDAKMTNKQALTDAIMVGVAAGPKKNAAN